MQIKTLTAARLINTGNYENTRFEALALLEEDEDPAAAMAALQVLLAAMVNAELVRRFPKAEERRYRHWLEEVDEEV